MLDSPSNTVNRVSSTRGLSGRSRIAARILTGGVWLGFGLVHKILDLVPRHGEIVSRILGDWGTRPVVVAIGVGECLMAAWIWTGRWPVFCAIVQTALIATMNTLEILLARDLLLSPTGMVAANSVLLCLAWGLTLPPTGAIRSSKP
jgi:hypothetical protein